MGGGCGGIEPSPIAEEVGTMWAGWGWARWWWPCKWGADRWCGGGVASDCTTSGAARLWAWLVRPPCCCCCCWSSMFTRSCCCCWCCCCRCMWWLWWCWVNVSPDWYKADWPAIPECLACSWAMVNELAIAPARAMSAISADAAIAADAADVEEVEEVVEAGSVSWMASFNCASAAVVSLTGW